MRLGRTPERIVLLYASAHSIYDRPFFNIGSDKFYPFGHSPQRLSVCSATFPKEQPDSPGSHGYKRKNGSCIPNVIPRSGQQSGRMRISYVSMKPILHQRQMAIA